MLIACDFARAVDPVLLATDCGITPDPWQADLLRAAPRRGLLLASRQSGKTTATSILALHRALYTPDALIVIVSPSQRQSAEMLRTIRLLHSKLDDAPALDTESVLKIEFRTGSRIMALPGTSDTIRGLAGAALVVIDEAARVDDELLAAVRPMLATNAAGSLIALTTPAGRRGWYYEAWHNGDPMWHRVRVSADQCPRISKEFLAEELKELGPSRFAEEYQLEFIDSNTAAFNTTLIEQVFTSEVKPLWN
jgi:Terminase large subunit, T4likevirus-type, N-terminal